MFFLGMHGKYIYTVHFGGSCRNRARIYRVRERAKESHILPTSSPATMIYNHKYLDISFSLLCVCVCLAPFFLAFKLIIIISYVLEDEREKNHR